MKRDTLLKWIEIIEGGEIEFSSCPPALKLRKNHALCAPAFKLRKTHAHKAEKEYKLNQ